MKLVEIEEEGEVKAAVLAVAALLRGQVVVLPTDTVYGLAADATNQKAVSKIFSIKGRKPQKPLPIFVSGVAQAMELGVISPNQLAVIAKAWPGKTTFVLKSKNKLAKETKTAETIGMRQPNCGFVELVLRKAKVPLTGTSANLAGQGPLRDAREVLLTFEGRKEQPDIVFSAGRLPFSHPSKVIDITGERAKIVRR